MSNLKYSIIYAVIRPEISEQVSVGLIIVDGEQTDVRYSSQKLDALQGSLPEKEYLFVSRVVSQLGNNKRANSVDDVNYLTRYSNILTTFSPLQSFDVVPPEESKDLLFRNYVYDCMKGEM